MKKVLTFLAILAVLLSMAVLLGCQEEKPAAAAAEVKKPGDGMYFRLVTHGGDDPFWAVVQPT